MDLFSKKDINEIALRLKQGATVVFPTETSYGLGCDAANQEAVDNIFKIKERTPGKPLLIVVPDVKSARKYLVWNERLKSLSFKHWPGALTIVGEYAGGNLARGVVSGDNTVAVRVTADPWLRNLCYQVDCPLVATSANISEEKELYDPQEFSGLFAGRENAPDVIVDAGILPKNPPTTIVSVAKNKLKILRQGAVKVVASPELRSFLWGALALGAAAFISATIIIYCWKTAIIDIENNTRLTAAFEAPYFLPGVKNPLKTVKGLYLTAFSAGSEQKIDEIINLVEKTELNAVVIDIKDYSGLVLYASRLPLVRELNTYEDRLGNVRALVNKLHEHKIYTIARQTVFQDPVLAEKKTDWAIKNKAGGVWRDRKGLAWVDPTRRDVWEYNIAIAKEVAKFGFDEINFDYVRFPSDGEMNNVVYTVGNKKKYEVMREFYQTLSRRLSSEPVWISLDMFGFVMEKTGEDDMNIGQRLADAVDNADYICPMMYPSHYPSGHLGFANPADHPGEVFENGFKMGAPVFAGQRAKVRPWIQAFNLGAVYGADKIRAQISVTEKYTDAGWLLWNASNRYTAAGLVTR